MYIKTFLSVLLLLLWLLLTSVKLISTNLLRKEKPQNFSTICGFIALTQFKN